MSRFEVHYEHFKREDTTNSMAINLYNDDGTAITPNSGHTWVGKIAKDDKYVGEYPLTISGTKIILPSSSLTRLPFGEYQLEVWETTGGQTTIYPNAGFIPVTIHRNADDTMGEVDPTTDINKIIADLKTAGTNLKVGSTTTLAAGSQAAVSQTIANGQNTINFAIPRGAKGDKGLDGSNGLTPSIDSNTKHWMIGNTDTGIIAEGQPEAFENEAALKAKYPNGKSGIMVTVDTGHKWLWANSTWTDAGVYQSVGIADGSVGWKQRTPVGSQVQVQYFGTGKINFDFGNKLITIPKDTNIVVGKNNIQIGADITTAIPTATDSGPAPKFFILTVSLQGTNFKCYTNATINGMSESEVVIAVCNNTEQTVEMNGDYLINGRARIAYAQPVIAYQYNVIYKINSDGTILVTFVGNGKNQVIISYPDVQMRVPVEASYTLNSSEALVYNSTNNSLEVLNFDSLLPDSLILIANYHGRVKDNSINAAQGDGNYEYYLDGTENVIYYGSTVTARKNGTEIDVNFDQTDKHLYYKDSVKSKMLV